MEEQLKHEFDIYTSQYDLHDLALSRKYYHSYRVMDLCKSIANNNHMNERDIEIVTIVGLLHDYARFYQWTHYHTYRDLDSIDHGDKAVEMLFDTGDIFKYCGKNEYYDEIYDAIKYHNKLKIPDDISEHNKQICRVIRDADKLDIFYLLGMNKDLFAECDEPIRKNIRDKFFNREQIEHKEVENSNEEIILKLSMLYDINFDYSCKYFLDYKLLDKLLESVKRKEIFQEYFDFIQSYIVERVRDYAREEI